jgi:hypothetical protein
MAGIRPFSFSKSRSIFSPENRHRGSGRPLSPATPPDMRVRSGRFRGLRKAIEELWESERSKVSNG